jgi:hypothetical protein
MTRSNGEYGKSSTTCVIPLSYEREVVAEQLQLDGHLGGDSSRWRFPVETGGTLTGAKAEAEATTAAKETIVNFMMDGSFRSLMRLYIYR